MHHLKVTLPSGNTETPANGISCLCFQPLFCLQAWEGLSLNLSQKPSSPPKWWDSWFSRPQLPGVSTATKANASLVFRVKLLLLWPHRTSQSGSHSSPWRNLLVAAHQQNVPLSYDSGFTPLGYSSFSMASLKAPDIPELSHFLTQKPDISPQWSHLEWSLIVGRPWAPMLDSVFITVALVLVFYLSLSLSLSE